MVVLATPATTWCRPERVTTGVVIAFPALPQYTVLRSIQQLSQVLDLTWRPAAASTSKIEELFTIPSGTPTATGHRRVDPGHLSGGESASTTCTSAIPTTVGELKEAP